MDERDEGDNLDAENFESDFSFPAPVATVYLDRCRRARSQLHPSRPRPDSRRTLVATTRRTLKRHRRREVGTRYLPGAMRPA